MELVLESCRLLTDDGGVKILVIGELPKLVAVVLSIRLLESQTFTQFQSDSNLHTKKTDGMSFALLELLPPGPVVLMGVMVVVAG